MTRCCDGIAVRREEQDQALGEWMGNLADEFGLELSDAIEDALDQVAGELIEMDTFRREPANSRRVQPPLVDRGAVGNCRNCGVELLFVPAFCGHCGELYPLE